jgi:hypothetical protein
MDNLLAAFRAEQMRAKNAASAVSVRTLVAACILPTRRTVNQPFMSMSLQTKSSLCSRASSASSPTRERQDRKDDPRT